MRENVQDTERRAAEVLELQKASMEKDHYLDSKATQGGRSPTIYHEILASKLPDEEKRLHRLAQEAFTLVVAGGETTARTLTVATYYILATKGVLPRLMVELEKALPDPHAIVKAKALEELPWLVSVAPEVSDACTELANAYAYKTAIIKESLRVGENITTRLPLISPRKPLYYQDWEIPPGVSFPVVAMAQCTMHEFSFGILNISLPIPLITDLDPRFPHPRENPPRPLRLRRPHGLSPGTLAPRTPRLRAHHSPLRAFWQRQSRVLRPTVHFIPYPLPLFSLHYDEE